jgi:hypothetical protein
LAGVLLGCLAPFAQADEIWVAPTVQQDLGGPGIGSNFFWPATVVGAVRLAWGVPNDLQTFQSAKVALIPHTPAGAGTLNLFVCRAQNSDLVGAACSGPIAHAFTGVANRLLEVDVSTSIATQVGTAGLNYLAVLAYSTPTTTTDHIVGLRFAYNPLPPSGVATLGANTFTGTQTAPAFAGSGAALTNVNANLLDGLDSTAFAAAVHGHDVSQVTGAAKLAGGNTFTGTQTIDTGNLDLDPSTAATGVITKNGVRFLHNVGLSNTFLGEGAGNLTLTGNQNTAIGVRALEDNTSGESNVVLGAGTMTTNTTGNSNTSVGVSSLRFNSTGGSNVALGQNALQNNSTGTLNTGLGALAGLSGTTGSNNIYLGANVFGAAGESNTMYLGKVGTQTKTLIAGVRGITTLNANAIPVLIDSTGQLGTVSSSRRFKEDIHDMADASRRLLQLRPVTFRYTQAYGDGSKPLQFGLVAEEVAEVFPELAVRSADGQVETVHYETLNVLLLNELQKQQARIGALEARERRIESLERLLGELRAALEEK